MDSCFKLQTHKIGMLNYNNYILSPLNPRPLDWKDVGDHGNPLSAALVSKLAYDSTVTQ